MEVILDTNICIYLIKQQPPAILERFLSHPVGDIGISSITGAELEVSFLAKGMNESQTSGDRACLCYTSNSKGRPMTYYTFEIVVEKETGDVGYLAYSPTLPGCFSNGKTIEEAKRSIREAIQQHLQSLLAHQQPIPQNEKLVHVEELTVAVP